MSAETWFSFHRNFSDDDRMILNNITNAYQCIDEQAESLRRREWKPLSSLVQFLNRENETHRSLINFYKLIPDFNRLDIEDRVLLIKSNVVKMVPLHCALIYRFHEHPKIGQYMSKWIGVDFHQRMSQVFQRCVRFIEHPLVLKLTLIIFIFSMHLSAPYGSDLSFDYSNRNTIREIQEFYATLLWRYLEHIYDENEAIQSMSMIIVQVLNFQTLVNGMEEVVCQEPDCHTFNELELSLLRLTS